MRHRLLLLAALVLAPLPAIAGSQSSSSSTSCSNGRCTRVESVTIEDRWGRRGWVREERWREGRGWRRQEREWHRAHRVLHDRVPRWRDRDDD